MTSLIGLLIERENSHWLAASLYGSFMGLILPLKASPDSVGPSAMRLISDAGL